VKKVIRIKKYQRDRKWVQSLERSIFSENNTFHHTKVSTVGTQAQLYSLHMEQVAQIIFICHKNRKEVSNEPNPKN
jgi:hypothetical protein